MKKIAAFIIMLSVLLMLGACGEREARTETKGISYDDLPDQGERNGISYEIIKNGFSRYEYSERGFIIIEPKEAGEPYYYVITGGEHSTGGYGIRIVDIRVDDAAVWNITVEETTPGPHEMVTEAFTYPICVLALSSNPDQVMIKNTDGAEWKRLDISEEAEPSQNSEEGTEPSQKATPRETQRATPRRALMAGGVLYLDTGYVSGVWGRCGNLDGSIIHVIDSMEIPDEEGEANFEAAGWQMGFEENTVEVPIDGEFYIFGAQGTEQGVQGYVPESVLQFMATVEDVTEDGYIIVKADFDIPEMFGRVIQKGSKYKLSMEHYERGIYTDTPVPGNVVTIICKGNMEDTDPAVITEIYSIAPVGGNVYQSALPFPALIFVFDDLRNLFRSLSAASVEP